MKSMRLRLFLAVAVMTAIPVFGPAASMEQAAAPSAAKKSMDIEDVIAWKTVSTTAISKNGEWFAYRVAPQEGDAELTVRNVATGKETKFPLGEVGAPAGGGPAAAVFAGGASLQFSDDSKWIAFTTSPLAGRGAAAAPPAAAGAEQRDRGQPGEWREEGIPERPPLRVLG